MLQVGTHPDECWISGMSSKEIADLYNKLECVIVPQYYGRRDDWLRMMKKTIGKVAYYFNSHRMMRRRNRAYL